MSKHGQEYNERVVKTPLPKPLLVDACGSIALTVNQLIDVVAELREVVERKHTPTLALDSTNDALKVSIKEFQEMQATGVRTKVVDEFMVSLKKRLLEAMDERLCVHVDGKVYVHRSDIEAIINRLIP